MKDELIQLGFGVHEAEVYLALLEFGKTGAGAIVKKTGLHRNIVYETLDKLIQKKLVLKTFGKNIAQFQLTDTKMILINEQNKLDLAKQLIPDLEKISKIKQEIIVYEGLEGYRNFSLNNMQEIPEKGTLYVLGSIGDRWYELMGDKLKRYMRIKQKKCISWKMVSFQKSTLDQVYNKKNKLDLIRILPEQFQAPSNVLIWDDYIALQTLVEPYSVIKIKNKALAEGYMHYFNLLWEQGKDVI